MWKLRWISTMNKRLFLFLVIFLSVFNIFYFYKKSKNEERVQAEEKQRRLEIVHKYHVEMEITERPERRSELMASDKVKEQGHEVQASKKIAGTEFTLDQMNELLAKEVASRLSGFDLNLSEFQSERNQLNDWLRKIYQTKKMVFFAESTIRAIDIFEVIIFLDVHKCLGTKLASKEFNYKDFCLKANAYLYNQNAKKGEEKWYQYNTAMNVSNLLWDFDLPIMPIFLSMDVEITRLLRLQLPMPSFNGPLLYYHLANDKILWDKNENFTWIESNSLEQKEFEQIVVNKNLPAIYWKKYKQEKSRR